MEEMHPDVVQAMVGTFSDMLNNNEISLPEACKMVLSLYSIELDDFVAWLQEHNIANDVIVFMLGEDAVQ